LTSATAYQWPVFRKPARVSRTSACEVSLSVTSPGRISRDRQITAVSMNLAVCFIIKTEGFTMTGRAGRLATRERQIGKGTGCIGANLGQYPLGSPQSRAAARSLVERRRTGRLHRTLILDIGEKEPSFTPWREGEDGSLTRICGLPRGMTMQEAERIVAENERKQIP
jgi:hypothetical protein